MKPFECVDMLSHFLMRNYEDYMNGFIYTDYKDLKSP